MIPFKLAVQQLLYFFLDMEPAGRQALVCFSTSVFVFITSYFSANLLGYTSQLWALNYWGPALYFCLFNFILRYCYHGYIYDVSVRAAFLGAGFASGLYLTSYSDGVRIFGFYTMVLSFFHFSEFMAVALTNPKTLNIDSYILNHSVQYGMAAAGSWIEWCLEYYFFPEMKMYFSLAYFGLFLCVAGEVLRKAAMFTATTSFTHLVQYSRQSDHKLITHGVYSLCRHPSYVGWFMWSIGTQILLLNPICTAVYAVASWTFFNERVYGEEITLLTFYGKLYRNYQDKVGTGLPFIKGFTISDEELRRAENEIAGIPADQQNVNNDLYTCGHSKSEHRRVRRPTPTQPPTTTT